MVTDPKLTQCPQCGGQITEVRGISIHRWKHDYNRCKVIAFAKSQPKGKEK